MRPTPVYRIEVHDDNAIINNDNSSSPYPLFLSVRIIPALAIDLRHGSQSTPNPSRSVP
jgi:hypothetical protein